MNIAKTALATVRGRHWFGQFLERLTNRHSLPIFQNVAWLLSEQVLGTIMRVTVGLWVVRYLGPEDFGKLSYCLAFLGFTMMATRIGLDDIIMRDLVADPGAKDEILASALALRFLSGAMVAAAMIVAAPTVLATEREVQIVLLIFAPLALVPSLEVLKSWYDAQVRAKYVVLASSGVVVGCGLARIGLILSESPLIAFGSVTLVEVAAPWIFVYIVFRRHGGVLRLRDARLHRMSELFRNGLPLFFSGFAVLACMRTDVVMLQWMAGAEATGIYASAVRLSEVWYMLPMAVAVSTAPALTRAKAHGKAHQRRRFRELLQVMVALSIVAAILMAVLADWLVVLLFGPAFAESGDVLRIHAWTIACVSVGSITTRLLVSEGLQSIVLRTTALGAVANVALNFFAIPLYGPVGAAGATFIAQSLSTCLGHAFCGEPARGVLKDQLQAVVWWDLWPQAVRQKAASLLRPRPGSSRRSE